MLTGIFGTRPRSHRRPPNLQWVALAALTAVGLSHGVLSLSAADTAKPARPNVVLIFADDK